VVLQLLCLRFETTKRWSLLKKLTGSEDSFHNKVYLLMNINGSRNMVGLSYTAISEMQCEPTTSKIIHSRKKLNLTPSLTREVVAFQDFAMSPESQLL